jgi:hypothetical protein
VKGTRLWQAPGSPIIQGRSRTERPFWERWLSAVVGAEALVFVVALVNALRASSVVLGDAMTSVALTSLLPALPGCLLGAALGVWLSRTMGWRKHLIVGTVMGAAFGAVSISLFQ